MKRVNWPLIRFAERPDAKLHACLDGEWMFTACGIHISSCEYKRKVGIGKTDCGNCKKRIDSQE